MNLKRSLTTIMLGAAITFGGQFAATTTAHAEDVWAYSDGRGDTYVMTETITDIHDSGTQMLIAIKVDVKEVKNGKTTIIPLRFKGGCIVRNDDNSGLGITRLEDSPYSRAIFRVVERYR